MIDKTDAFLLCRNLTPPELAPCLFGDNHILIQAAARRMQFFPYHEIKNTIALLARSRYCRHRAAAAFIRGQIQTPITAGEAREILGLTADTLANDKSRKVQAEAALALGHLFSRQTVPAKRFDTVEKQVRPLFASPPPSLACALSFAAAYLPARKYIRDFLIRNLNSGQRQTLSWSLFALNMKSWYCRRAAAVLSAKLDFIRPYSPLYCDVAAYLVRCRCSAVIPYLKKAVGRRRLDDEIYRSLYDSDFAPFAALRREMLERFGG